MWRHGGGCVTRLSNYILADNHCLLWSSTITIKVTFTFKMKIVTFSAGKCSATGYNLFNEEKYNLLIKLWIWSRHGWVWFNLILIISSNEAWSDEWQSRTEFSDWLTQHDTDLWLVDTRTEITRFQEILISTNVNAVSAAGWNVLINERCLLWEMFWPAAAVIVQSTSR